jgi:hypothetical protein
MTGVEAEMEVSLRTSKLIEYRFELGVSKKTSAT